MDLLKKLFQVLLATIIAFFVSRRVVYTEEKQTEPASPNRKPNIIVILSDDHGYAELGVQGCKDIPTPNIDSIATAGVRFTNGYVSAPLCSPTRAGLITGRYQQRFGHEFNPGPPNKPSEKSGLPLTETTLPESLKKLGYTTGMFGKWHLGYNPEQHPLKRGFDEFFGFIGGAHSYMDYKISQIHNENILKMSDPVVDGYTTEIFARETVAFIEKHKTEPFFIYLPFNAVHAPLEATEKYLARFPDMTDKKRKTFAAMMSAMDDAVGTVLESLHKTGIEDNTLIFFFGDNGGPTDKTTSNNYPLNGRKGEMYEGGIRVPFLAKWPARFPAGIVYKYPVISLDVFPTAVIAAGGVVPKNVDGVNLIPYLTGELKTPPHERLFWRMGAKSAIRDGDWKLFMLKDQPPQLYNLADDIGEKKDLALEKPEIVEKLLKSYKEWNQQLAKPLWSGEKGK